MRTRNSADMSPMIMEISQSLINDSFFSPPGASKSSPKNNSRATSLAIRAATPGYRGSRPIVSVDFGHRCSHPDFNRLLPFQDRGLSHAIKCLRRTPCGFGSSMENMPATTSSVRERASSMYPSPLGKLSFMLWTMREGAMSATATPFGLIRTIGPVVGQ